MLASTRLAWSSRLSLRMHTAAMASQLVAPTADWRPACSSASPLECSTPAATPAAQPTLWQKLVEGHGTGRKRRAAAAAEAATAACPSMPRRQAHSSHAPPETDSVPELVPIRQRVHHRQHEQGRRGQTDLGQGAAVMFQPAAFSLPDKAALYVALKVRVLSCPASSLPLC